MTKDSEIILDIFADSSKFYLKQSNGICEKVFEEDEGKTDYLSIYRIDEITFEDKAPRKEALENVISSMNIPGVVFFYIILGNQDGVNFYYGVAKDFKASKQPDLEIIDIGEKILEPSLKGNFRGSIVKELDPKQKSNLLKTIDKMRCCQVLEGVPGINKDDEDFQSVDRIVDVMLGDTFALMVIARPLADAEIMGIQNNMFDLYDIINPLSKTSIQESSGKSDGSSVSKSEGESNTEGKSTSVSEQTGKSLSKNITDGTSTGKSSGTSTNESKSTTNGTTKETVKNDKKTNESISGQEGTSNGKTEGHNSGTSHSETKGESTSVNKSESKGDSTSFTKNTSVSNSSQTGNNLGSAATIEVVNKSVQDWIKYLDEVIIPRLDYGRGKGLFISTAVLLSEEKADLIKLENTIRSIYGGESGNKVPFKAYDLNSVEQTYVKKVQIPSLIFTEPLAKSEVYARTVFSQFINDENCCQLGNWMSSKELSLFAGLPQKEVVGLSLREEVEFGLNLKKDIKNPIYLGNMVQSGNELNNIPISFDKANFDKHIFVTGVTGSGKTTTCQKLLLESGEKFLVIEPAKTEYRILTEKFDDLLVFTLGKDTVAPFRLNPFEFFPHENITSRVDMIKASMEASFDMEAAIPQILEAAIYRCYENCGWNISTNNNELYDNPFADGVYAFPTLSDLLDIVKTIVVEQGFDERLRDEYIGSIRARLQGLVVGSKGLMLNTRRSIDFEQLLEHNVILELEDIRSASEKSLIMGFILTNLIEAIKGKYNKCKKNIEHITLIEEAHRLLSKYSPGDGMNRKQGVEMFSDMLAEVRKYGEALIIADQIPNKLTPEVLKNTNTKIVHRIFAQDDKEAIGNTMALKDEQKEHLSYLETGRAVMMAPGWSKAVQIQIAMNDDNNTRRLPTDDESLRKRILGYYAKTYKRGIFIGLENLDKEPTLELLDTYLNYIQDDTLKKLYRKAVYHFEVSERFVRKIREILKLIDKRTFADFILASYYGTEKYTLVTAENIEKLLDELMQKGTETDMKKYDDILCN